MSIEKLRNNRNLVVAFALVAIALLTTPILMPAIAKKANGEMIGKAVSQPITPSVVAKELSLSPTEVCEPTTWQLTAGQTIPVGTVTVSNDATNIYVTYTLDELLDPDACFGTLHLWVGNDLLNLPVAGNGAPIPGQLPYQKDATGLKTYTFQVPFASLNITDVTKECGTTLFVVTHAEVFLDCTDKTDHETAFGGPEPGSGPRWWFFARYNICCDDGDPDPPFCQTAFGKGGYVWTTDKKSNPETLPSLNLTKNRWGWAINLTATGETTYDIWAGAGLNKTGNGVKVGTLTVVWDSTTAIVTYTMDAGYYLGEVHLYAGDGSPTTIAPGQYGYLDSFNPNRSTYTFNVPLADTNLTGGVWIVAHAVVCNRP